MTEHREVPCAVCLGVGTHVACPPSTAAVVPGSRRKVASGSRPPADNPPYRLTES
jgi:hypothetical protein